MHYDPQVKRDIPDADATFLYQTRDGRRGMLPTTDRVIRTGKNSARLADWPKGAGFHLVVRFNWNEIIP